MSAGCFHRGNGCLAVGRLPACHAPLSAPSFSRAGARSHPPPCLAHRRPSGRYLEVNQNGRHVRTDESASQGRLVPPLSLAHATPSLLPSPLLRFYPRGPHLYLLCSYPPGGGAVSCRKSNQSSNQCLSRTYCVPSTLPDSGYTAMHKTDTRIYILADKTARKKAR